MNWEAQSDDWLGQVEERLRGILKELQAENEQLRRRVQELKAELHQPDPRFTQVRVQEAREV